MEKKSKSLAAHKAVLKAFLLALPFIVLNFVVSLRVEPFYSLLGAVPAVRKSSFLPLLLLLLFPIAAFIAFKPVLKKPFEMFYVINVLTALLLTVIFLMLIIVLGEEFYRCEILSIPNCD